VRNAKKDWDLDVVAGPRGAVCFALDLAYQADLEERVFQFGPPRNSEFLFPLPVYLSQPAEIFRVDADGVVQVQHTVEAGSVEIRDQVSRVAMYVVSMKPGESQRLESLRQTLIAQEDALGFAPDRNPNDLKVLIELVEEQRPQ